MHFGKACEKLGLDFRPPAMVIKRATSGEENYSLFDGWIIEIVPFSIFLS